MIVDQIENGIVLDHIKAGYSMLIYNYLGLNDLDCTVAIIKNVKSSKMGKKDIIKIDSLIDINFDILVYIDAKITVNVIRDGKLVKKQKLELPETLINVIKCKNPRCITSVEQGIEHTFKLVDKENKVYRCIYCESKQILPKKGV
mgnify:CR=1 FL=1